MQQLREIILHCPDSVQFSSTTGDKELEKVPHGLHSARAKASARNLVVEEILSVAGDKELKGVAHGPYSARAKTSTRNLIASNLKRTQVKLYIEMC